MRPVRVLVVDDEKPARHRLLELLTSEPEVEVVGVCTSGVEAIRVVQEAAQRASPVELIFLDIQMPGMDGFAVLDALPPANLPLVVFVTAYDRYALRAFEAHAVDYLLKPYSDERFGTALGRAIHQLRADGVAAVVHRVEALLEELRRDRRAIPGAEPSPLGAGAVRPYLDRIAIRERDRILLLPVEEITWIQAEGVYVRLHTSADRAHLHRALLGELEAGLDPRRFVRIHRSTIVNVDAVEELRVGGPRDYTVRLRGGTELRLSRTYREHLQERLGQRL